LIFALTKRFLKTLLKLINTTEHCIDLYPAVLFLMQPQQKMELKTRHAWIEILRFFAF